MGDAWLAAPVAVLDDAGGLGCREIPGAAGGAGVRACDGISDRSDSDRRAVDDARAAALVAFFDKRVVGLGSRAALAGSKAAAVCDGVCGCGGRGRGRGGGRGGGDFCGLGGGLGGDANPRPRPVQGHPRSVRGHPSSCRRVVLRWPHLSLLPLFFSPGYAKPRVQVGSDPRIDECFKCGGVGKVLLCDDCSGASHVQCAGLSGVPDVHGGARCASTTTRSARPLQQTSDSELLNSRRAR